MGKETKDNRHDKSGGGDNLGDSLDQASEQAAKLNDQALAKLFIEANQEAEEKDNPPIKELFVEEKESYVIEEKTPDPEFLKEIYDSLARKEIHHKKLLEEGSRKNKILQFLRKTKSLLNLSFLDKEQVILTPVNWKIYSIFWKKWKVSNRDYFNNFASWTDLYLRKEGFAKKMIKWEIAVMFLILLFSCPVIVLFSSTPWAVSEINKLFAQIWSSFILSSAIISTIFSIVPVFFFMSLWFVNVNHLHTSKYFHLFLFGSFTISFIFMALSVFNAGLFYLIDDSFQITNKFIPSRTSTT